MLCLHPMLSHPALNQSYETKLTEGIKSRDFTILNSDDEGFARF